MDIKTMALVLRGSNYRDYDKMVTLFSGEHGKMDVMATGCRKQNSPLLPLTQVFACGEYYLAKKGDRYYLSQGELKDSFFDLRSHMPALTVAMIMSEIIDRTAMPEQPNKRYFALMVNALFVLSRGGRPKDVFAFFVFKLLDILGMKPLTDACVSCGAPEVAALDKGGGGGLCAECASDDEKSMYTDMERALAMPSTKIGEFVMSGAKTEFDAVCELLVNSVEFEPKSMILLKTMMN